MNRREGSTAGHEDRNSHSCVSPQGPRTAPAWKKGVTQIDYIIAIATFILVFALVVQYVSGYFATVGDKANIHVMTAQGTSLLDAAERGYEPQHWPQTQPNSSTVLLLHLDNSTLDSSSYGNNGTISGANCSAAVLGMHDSGCGFDGSTSFINISDSGSLDVSTVTVEAWIRPNILPASGNKYFVNRMNSGGTNNHFAIGFAAGGSSALQAWIRDSINCDLTGTNLSAGVWQHVAMTLNGTEVRLYKDGILDANRSCAMTLSAQTGSLYIGTYNAASEDWVFNGTIDEVIIYNRSLAGNEVYEQWAYENLLDRIGLATRAYRMYVFVNNTDSAWYSGGNPRHIANELIKVNYTDIGFGADVASSYVIDGTNTPANYQISGNTITFKTTINPNADKTFTVYFDDDSNFIEQTTAITGTDNLTEIRTKPQELPIVQWRKMLFLNSSNYTRAKNATGLPRDFSMRIIDRHTNATVLNFGPPPPPSGNVVSFRRFTLFQNSTGAVRRGELRVMVW